MRRVDSGSAFPSASPPLLLSAPFRWRRKSPDGRPRERGRHQALGTRGPHQLESAVSSLRAMVGRENLYFLTFAEAKGLWISWITCRARNILTLRTDSFLHLVADAVAAHLAPQRSEVECSLDLDFFARATALLAC